MLSLPGPVEIFLYSAPADLRKSYDSLHQTLGYVSPNQFEADHAPAQAA